MTHEEGRGEFAGALALLRRTNGTTLNWRSTCCCEWSRTSIPVMPLRAVREWQHADGQGPVDKAAAQLAETRRRHLSRASATCCLVGLMLCARGTAPVGADRYRAFPGRGGLAAVATLLGARAVILDSAANRLRFSSARPDARLLPI